MADNNKYSDLKINNDDLELDNAGNPVFIFDRDVIAQDIRHAIRESGVLYQLIGESRPQHQALVFNRLQIEIEKDLRVLPGTSEVQIIGAGNLLLTAQTELGQIELGVNL